MTLVAENELLALAFRGLSKSGFEVWIRKGCGLDRCFPSVFRIVTKFPRQKSGSISSYFRGGNLVMLSLRCVIAHKMLFSPSFWRENTTMGMPHFHGENLVEFCVLVRYGASAGFRVCVYGACQCAHARTS